MLIRMHSNLRFLCKSDLISLEAIKFISEIFFDDTEFNSKNNFNEDVKYDRG